MENHTTNEAAQSSTSVTSGSRLIQAREAHNYTVAEVASRLRLRPEIIEALETNNLSKLPGGTFSKGYLRIYADLLELPVAEIMADYERLQPKTQPTFVPKHRISKEHRQDQSHVLWGSTAAAASAFILVLVVTAVWLFRQDAAPVNDEQVVANETQMFPDQTTEQALLPNNQTGDTASPSVSPTVPIVPAASSLIEMNSPMNSAAPSVPSDNAAQPGEIRLDLTLVADSWVQVLDKNGRILINGLLREGQRKTVNGVPPVKVFFGNAPGVEVLVNGAPFSTKSYTKSNNLARFTVQGQ